jgi:hypothetical protein
MEPIGTHGRYRWRTRLRPHLPWFVINLNVAAKGRRDCGNHAFYKSTDDLDRCYHCEVGQRTPSQTPPRSLD